MELALNQKLIGCTGKDLGVWLSWLKGDCLRPGQADGMRQRYQVTLKI